MRIPIPAVILSCLLVTVVVWLVGTRNVDLTTPPTPEELMAVHKEWEASRPNIPPPKPISATLLADRGLVKPKTPAANIEPEPEQLPVGNLDHAPALTEYGALGDQGVEKMIELATHLEAKGHFPRALLAWERVIDTCDPSDDERSQAVTSIKRLKPTLPPWNPDPAEDIVVTLHAGATLKDKKLLETALQAAADLVSEASGNVIKVKTKASIGRSSGIKTPRIPIAIWISRPGTSSSNATAETPPISFMAEPGQSKVLISQIEAGIYSLLRSHLASATSFSPLPEYPPGVTPDELLKYHVTRLMWREFVNSMKE